MLTLARSLENISLYLFIYLLSCLIKYVKVRGKFLGDRFFSLKLRQLPVFTVRNLNKRKILFSVLIYSWFLRINQRAFQDFLRSQREFEHWEANRISVQALNVCLDKALYRCLTLVLCGKPSSLQSSALKCLHSFVHSILKLLYISF